TRWTPTTWASTPTSPPPWRPSTCASTPSPAPSSSRCTATNPRLRPCRNWRLLGRGQCSATWLLLSRRCYDVRATTTSFRPATRRAGAGVVLPVLLRVLRVLLVGVGMAGITRAGPSLTPDYGQTATGGS